MYIYLQRHGIAEEQGAHRSDAERALTGEGREKLKAILKRAAKAGVAPSLILTSPYVRARQTAEMAAEALAPESPIVQIEPLVPYGTPQGVWEKVREHRTQSSIMLTGHEPLLSQIVSYFLNSPALKFEYKKGAIVAMTLDSFGGDPHATLEWILTPLLAR